MEGHDASLDNKKVEIDTSTPFLLVKEAVVLFGERVLAGEIYTNRLKEVHNAPSIKSFRHLGNFVIRSC